MWDNQKKKDEKSADEKKIEKKYFRAYMSSYEWNYMVLEIVDYLEESLPHICPSDRRIFVRDVNENNDPDSWKNFKDYCTSNSLNWRVLKKMIEYSVHTSFESEADLVGHDAFKPFKKITS